MGIAKGPRLGPVVVNPQKQPVVESELIANNTAMVAIENCFCRSPLPYAVARHRGVSFRRQLTMDHGQWTSLISRVSVIVLVWRKLAAFFDYGEKIDPC